MDNLKLIYVNHVGKNWRDLNIYEFIFSDQTDEVEGDDWDVYPASSGNVTPPPTDVIRKVAVIETELDLIVVKDSDKYSIWDSVDGIIPLAYEDIEDYDIYPEHRLVFPFAMDIDDVSRNLLPKEIILEFKNIENEN